LYVLYDNGFLLTIVEGFVESTIGASTPIIEGIVEQALPRFLLVASKLPIGTNGCLIGSWKV
jgi:hypothetical protein